MTYPQMISVAAAVGVAAMYLWPLLPTFQRQDPELLAHIRNVLAVRDSYRTPEVADKCNALMEALLGIKP
jgi:hypothetical protein